MKKRTAALNGTRLTVFWILTVMTVFFITGCTAKNTENTQVRSADDLPGKRIAVQLGTTGDIYASDYEEEGSVIERFNKAADAVQALKLGKVDCVIIDQQPAEAFAALNPSLHILETAFAEEEYAICISKDKAELRENINSAIRELKENGILEQIKSNYIGDETKGKNPYIHKSESERTGGTLKMATNAAFEPYEYIENNEVTGIDVDIAQAICDILNMNLKIDNIEFDAIINSVQSGKSDVGIAGMTITEDRLKSIDFTEPYTTAIQVILVNTETVASSSSLSEKIHNNFIEDSRWKYITSGLATTLLISICSVIIGIVLGFIIAVCRSSCDKTGQFKILNNILRLYLTIIRGTPTMIQLLIIYYVIFASSDINKVFVAIIAFGLNSSAYIAEIVRGGIMAIDQGQFEAGRSLGFTHGQTMLYFIIPQAFKNVLPALCNEFIVLIKETSISGYIGIMDLTRGGDFIRSRTYEALLPLVSVAIVYLIIVVILTNLVSRLERRLKKNAGR